MRLIADGATPIARLVMVNDLETEDGHAFELAEPLFLAVGDRIRFEGDALIVVRAGGGEPLTPSGGWATRCGLRAGRRLRVHARGAETR
ncbi:hypothetical protein [Streptomyces sp. NPDC001568]|uniref:hypothetical protein n=1 Tax=Streptomyces sp. NPDC001568 TaxID=3364588 RepID=UPI003691DAE2